MTTNSLLQISILCGLHDRRNGNTHEIRRCWCTANTGHTVLLLLEIAILMLMLLLLLRLQLLLVLMALVKTKTLRQIIRAEAVRSITDEIVAVIAVVVVIIIIVVATWLDRCGLIAEILIVLLLLLIAS